MHDLPPHQPRDFVADVSLAQAAAEALGAQLMTYLQEDVKGLVVARPCYRENYRLSFRIEPEISAAWALRKALDDAIKLHGITVQGSSLTVSVQQAPAMRRLNEMAASMRTVLLDWVGDVSPPDLVLSWGEHAAIRWKSVTIGRATSRGSWKWIMANIKRAWPGRSDEAYQSLQDWSALSSESE